ncbi:MAG: hypothetical protein AB7S26_26990 [Sandaracinaceae bacterium]
MRIQHGILLAGILAISGSLVGCTNPVEEINEVADCANLCDRYRDCYDSSYDTDACRDRCNTYVDADGGMQYAADECDACLDAHSCAESFACVVECSPILP